MNFDDGFSLGWLLIPRFNRRFSVTPAAAETAFRPVASAEELQRILATKVQRQASNGSTISYRGQSYRLFDQYGRIALLRPKSKVYVFLRADPQGASRDQTGQVSLQAFGPCPKKGSPMASTSTGQSPA